MSYSDSDCIATPIGNTGVNSQPAPCAGYSLVPQIDYLSLVWESYEHERVIQRIDSKFALMLDYECIRTRSALGGGSESLIAGVGCMLTVRLSDNPVEPRTWYKLELTGVGCQSRGTEGVARLMGWFNGTLNAHCTRIDIQVSDYARELDLDVISDCIRGGKYSGFKNWKITESKQGRYRGKTCYLGSRKADKFVRIYDKYAESKGTDNCIRYEVEYKGGAAQEVFLEYVASDSYSKKQQLLCGVCIGNTTFMEKKDSNLSRGTLFAWWERFVGRICSELVVITAKNVPTIISRKIAWVCRNVAKSLAILHDAMGVSIVDDIIYRAECEARSRISNFERQQIIMFREYSIEI